MVCYNLSFLQLSILRAEEKILNVSRGSESLKQPELSIDYTSTSMTCSAKVKHCFVSKIAQKLCVYESEVDYKLVSSSFTVSTRIKAPVVIPLCACSNLLQLQLINKSGARRDQPLHCLIGNICPECQLRKFII